MRRHQTGLIAATLLALAAPALAPAARAQERPPLTPTRDVAVTYRVVGQIPGQPAGAGQGPREMRMSWLTAAGKLRIETGGAGAPSGYMLVDRRNNLSELVGADVRSFFKDKVFETTIPRNVRVSEAPSHGLPVILYDSRSAGAQAYIRLAAELLKRERARKRTAGPAPEEEKAAEKETP